MTTYANEIRQRADVLAETVSDLGCDPACRVKLGRQLVDMPRTTVDLVAYSEKAVCKCGEGCPVAPP
jgi:hypothetical protein